MATQAQREASARYAKKAVKHCGFNLNRFTDAEIIAHLEAQPNRAAYLKDLIHQDMERTRAKSS